MGEIATAPLFFYRAFGLRISSSVELPELTRADAGSDPADVVIQVDDLSALWKEQVAESDNFVQRADTFLFRIPNTAIYMLQGGSTIIVSPEEDADHEKVRVYLLGTCMGALLLQRRVLPLHGSAVVIDGKAYAFVGDSGAGKSTLAAAFLSKGFSLLSDDVIAVNLHRHAGIPVVEPAYPQQKLWQESIDRLGFSSNPYRPVYQEITKYAVPVAAEYAASQADLAGIFELTPASIGGIEIRALHKLERIQKVQQHTYRKALVAKMDLREWHFSAAARISSHAGLYQIQRPLTGFSAFDIVEQVIQIIDKGVYAAR